jgi:antitoxin component YwqK of YwqJK toxin-antitoxin module
MKKYWPLLICSLLFSCQTKMDKATLSCIQLINRNGFSETIGSKEKLAPFQTMNFETPQPYSQVLRIYKKTQEGKTPSLLTTYHPNGLPHQFLQIVDGRAFGLYREWHPNGRVKIEAKVVGGDANLNSFSQKNWLFDGVCKSYDEEGHLLSEIPYNKGTLDGTSHYYFPDGKIQKKISYAKDELHGNWVEFSLPGNLSKQSSYEKGKKEGISLGFWENQKPSFFEEYEQDLLKKGEYFFPSSQPIGGVENKKGISVRFLKEGRYELVEYQNGIPDGKVEVFDSKNELLQLFHVKNDQKIGEEVLFWQGDSKTRIPKISLSWEEGMIHGTVKSWYENGSLESQKEFRRNKKNGPASCWYPNGLLMMIEEYEEDLLQEGKYFKPHQSFPVSSVSKGEGEVTLFDKEGIFLRKIRYHKGKPQES